MAIKFGVNPCSSSKNEKGIYGDAEVSLTESLFQASVSGYTGVELGSFFGYDVPKLKSELCTQGLELVSMSYKSQLFYRSLQEELHLIQSRISLLKELGASVFMLTDLGQKASSKWIPGSPCRPRLNNEEWKKLGKKLSEIGAYLADHGLTLAYHPQQHSLVESEVDILHLLGSTQDKVGLLLDTGNFRHYSVPIVSFIHDLGNRIKHVHCRDFKQQEINAEGKPVNVDEDIYSVPGEGDLDFESILKALLVTDYSGWLVVEGQRKLLKNPPRPSIGPAYLYLNQLVSHIGSS